MRASETIIEASEMKIATCKKNRGSRLPCSLLFPSRSLLLYCLGRSYYCLSLTLILSCSFSSQWYAISQTCMHVQNISTGCSEDVFGKWDIFAIFCGYLMENACCLKLQPRLSVLSTHLACKIKLYKNIQRISYENISQVSIASQLTQGISHILHFISMIIF